MLEMTVEQWFESVPVSQDASLRKLREMIMSSGDDVIEEIKWNRPCYSTLSGLFSYLDSASHHLTIGFQKGAALNDPYHLLQGSGKDMRHVKIKTEAELDVATLKDLIGQAYRISAR